MGKRSFVGVLCLSLVLVAVGVVSAQTKPRDGDFYSAADKPTPSPSAMKVSAAYYPVLLSNTVNNPWGVAVTASGNQVYVNNPWQYLIYKWEAGVTSNLLSTSTNSSVGKWRKDFGYYFGDDTGTVFHYIMDESLLKTVGSLGYGRNSYPSVTALEIDPITGTIYFYDYYSSNLYRLPNFDGKTPQLIAHLPFLTYGLAIKDNYIYIARDSSNSIYRMPKAGGPLKVYASVPYDPNAIEFDSQGNLYIAHYWGRCVSKVKRGTRTGQVIASGFVFPFYVAVDAYGNVYFTDYGTACLWKLTRKVPINN